MAQMFKRTVIGVASKCTVVGIDDNSLKPILEELLIRASFCSNFKTIYKILTSFILPLILLVA